MNLSLETIVAILGALGIGGLAAKLLERLFSKQDRRETEDRSVRARRETENDAMRGREIDDSAAMRRELWDRVSQLEDQVKELGNELDRWKARYYEREAIVIQLRTDLERLQSRVTAGEGKAGGET